MREEQFFRITPVFKKVEKEAFDLFLSYYPRRLGCSPYGDNEPFLVIYEDFDLHPFTIIGECVLCNNVMGGYCYYIMENYVDVYNSRVHAIDRVEVNES